MSSVTIKDIAKALNIAPSTVSSCLNGDTEKRRISPKRVEEVRKKADEMGYIPNILASRIFKRNQKKYFGIIVRNDTAMSSIQSILNYILSDFNNRNDCDHAILYASGDNLFETLKNGVGLGIKDFIVLGYIRGADLKQINFEKLPKINIYAANYYFDTSDYDNSFVAHKIGFAREEYYRELKLFLEKSNYGPVTMVQALEYGQKIPQT
jgi:DNA-binding LacI/PurR family transcriptional regulator